nr:hypothetical protein Iba_chr10eCG10850 [Ipomoea batatas]
MLFLLGVKGLYNSFIELLIHGPPNFYSATNQVHGWTFATLRSALDQPRNVFPLLLLHRS